MTRDTGVAPIRDSNIHSAVRALILGRAGAAERQIVREALETGQITVASGDRSVAVGGSVGGSIVTGDGNLLLTGAEAVEQVLARVLLPALQQLPADLGDFTGRSREVALLAALLRAGKGRAAIGGMGGLGKSALAVHVAHQVAADYPDGQIFAELRGTSERPLRSVAAMARVIRSFEPAAEVPEVEAEAASVYRSVLAGKRVLLVLDDARDAAQVRPLLPPVGCGLIVTARQMLGLEGVQPIRLEMLSNAEARELLASILGAHRASAAALHEIARLCGYLPLALRVAGTFLAVHRDWSADAYARALRDERQRLRRLRIEDDVSLDVAASLTLSLRQLDAEKQVLATRWRLLSVFPESFDPIAAAWVWATSADDARDTLSTLTVRSLVLFEGDRYRLHDLMRSIGRAAFRVAEQHAEIHRIAFYNVSALHAVYYQQVLGNTARLYEQGGQAVLAALALFDLEKPNIEAGQAWAAAHASNDDNPARLCMAYLRGLAILELRLSPRQQIEWAQAALSAAKRLGDRKGELNALANTGNAYAKQREHHKALEIYQESLTTAREVGDRIGEIAALGNIGSCYQQLREFSLAIESHRQQVALARACGDSDREASALANFGTDYLAQGDARRALELYDQALPGATGDPRVEAPLLGNIGRCHAALGEPARASEFYEKSFKLARDIGDQPTEANALRNLVVALDGLVKGNKLSPAEASSMFIRMGGLARVAQLGEELSEWGSQS